MRPGLVAVGAAFALVGAGAIVAVLWAPDAPPVERASYAVADQLAPGDYAQYELPASATNSADLALHWTASGVVAVDWFAQQRCGISPTGWCTVGNPVENWTRNLSGAWSFSGAASGYYTLYVQNVAAPNGSAINFSATFVEQYRPSSLTLLPLPLGVVLAGGSLLAGTGAVALYLGLFLPSGVYSGFPGPLPEGWDNPEPDPDEAPPPDDH